MRSIRTRRSRRAGCAARTASSTRSCTLPYRPYHTHDEEQKLTPGEVYEVDVEVWPTCIVLPKGYRLALSVRGTDYVYPGEPGAGLETLGKVWTGCGPFVHNDARDRPPKVFGGDVTLHAGPGRPAHLLLPVIPKNESSPPSSPQGGGTHRRCGI